MDNETERQDLAAEIEVAKYKLLCRECYATIESIDGESLADAAYDDGWRCVDSRVKCPECCKGL